MNNYMMPILHTRDAPTMQETRPMQTTLSVHNTAMDDSILPWLTPRYLQPQILCPLNHRETPRLVPSESLEKVLLEVNLCNEFEKQNKIDPVAGSQIQMLCLL